MACLSNDLDAIFTAARPAPAPDPVTREAVEREAARAALWLARRRFDNRGAAGERLAMYLASLSTGHTWGRKGLLAIGPPGRGKSAALKAIAAWTGAP